MADFARWGYAIGEALGDLGNEFLEQYTANQGKRNIEVLNTDIVATLTVAFMKDKTEWTGLISELYNQLSAMAPQYGINSKGKEFPTVPNVLSRRLNGLKSNLQEAGISFKTSSKMNGTEIVLTNEKIPQLSSYSHYGVKFDGVNAPVTMADDTQDDIALGFKVNKDRQFEIDPNTAPIVETVFEMYANGKTVTEITRHLNSLGYKTSRGVAFNKNSLHTMLKNKRYIGVYTYKGKEIPSGMPRIISDELFNKVAEIMAKNKKAPARARAKVEYLLTTKLFCGRCKEMMTGFSATGKQGTVYNYYICNGRKAKRCEKDMVKKNYIENLVLSQCRKLLSAPNIEKISKEVSAICEAERDTSNLRYLQKRLAESERKRENALNAVLETDIPRLRENLYERIAQLEAEQENIREEISKEIMPFPSLTAPKIKFFLMALKKSSMTDEKYKKMLIKIFVNKIFLYDDRITITFHSGDDTVEINDRLLSELEEKDGEIKNLFLADDGPP